MTTLALGELSSSRRGRYRGAFDGIGSGTRLGADDVYLLLDDDE